VLFGIWIFGFVSVKYTCEHLYSPGVMTTFIVGSIIVDKLIGLSKLFSRDILTRTMKYRITNYTRKRATQIGVVVKPSTNPTKKIDVFRKSRKIASVGAAGMNDFPTYIRTRGLAYAKTRRRLYKMRHERDRHTKWTNGWLADKLLW
jgi:hypothetical protein